MTTFLIPLAAVCVGMIVWATVRYKRALAQDSLDEDQVKEQLYVTIRDKGGPWRLSVWWMDWDAVEWWPYDLLWDDYDEKE